MKKIIAVVVILTLLFLCSCTSESGYSKTNPELSTTTSETKTPVSSTPEKPKVSLSFIDSPIEDTRLYIENNETITYSGNVTLTIYLDSSFDESILNYMFINGSPVDSDNTYISTAYIKMNLDDTLPNDFTLTIIKDDTNIDSGLSEEFIVSFIHHNELSCTISVIDMDSTTSNQPADSSAFKQTFLYTFSKPVIKDSLLFPDFMDNYNYYTKWLSDNEMQLTINNEFSKDYLLGVGYIEGLNHEYGNKMKFSGRILDPMNTDCIFSFHLPD